MKRLFLILGILWIASCECQDELTDPIPLPACISSALEDSLTVQSLLSIIALQKKGEIHFYLHTGASAWDGVEYIVNSTCDTLCYLCGECFQPDCIRDYCDESQVIWSRD